MDDYFKWDQLKSEANSKPTACIKGVMLGEHVCKCSSAAFIRNKILVIPI